MLIARELPQKPIFCNEALDAPGQKLIRFHQKAHGCPKGWIGNLRIIKACHCIRQGRIMINSLYQPGNTSWAKGSASHARAYDVIADESGAADLKAAMIRHLHRELFSFSPDDARHCGSYRGRALVQPSSAAQDGGLIGSVPPQEIHKAVEDLVSWWNAKTAAQCLSPVHQVAAFVGRFLVIAPFARGNHRLALLLAGYLLRQSGHDYLSYLSLEHMMMRAGASFARVLTPARGQPPLTEVDWLGLFHELAWTLEHGLRAFAKRAKRARRLPADLSPVDTKILSAFIQEETLCNRDLVEFTGLNRNTLKLHLRHLVARGLLTIKGAGRGARYQRGQWP